MKIRYFLLALLLIWCSHLAHAAIGIDGTCATSTSSGTSVTLTLSTTQSNDEIVVLAVNNAGGITSISATTPTSLTFTQRASSGGGSYVEEWTAPAPSALSSESIQLTIPSGGAALYAACGISGANTSSPYDPNAAIPVGTETAADPSFSTTDSPDLVIAALTFSTTSAPTAGTGWTLIAAPSGYYTLFEYQVFSSAQSGTVVVPGTGSGDEKAAIVDAYVQASAGGSCPHDGWASNGTWAIPNGTSGTYALKDGTKGTPNCTGGTPYLQKPATFGVN